MCKVVLLRNANVGKTSVLKRLVFKSFSETYAPTTGLDFGIWRKQLKEKAVRLHVFDVSGTEGHKSAQRYCKAAYCAVVVAEAASNTLKEDVKPWREDAKLVNTPCYLLVNKCDAGFAHTDEQLQ